WKCEAPPSGLKGVLRPERRPPVPSELLRLPNGSRRAEHRVFLDDRAVDPHAEEAAGDLPRQPADEELDEGHVMPLGFVAPTPVVEEERPLVGRAGRDL